MIAGGQAPQFVELAIEAGEIGQVRQVFGSRKISDERRKITAVNIELWRPRWRRTRVFHGHAIEEVFAHQFVDGYESHAQRIAQRTQYRVTMHAQPHRSCVGAGKPCFGQLLSTGIGAEQRRAHLRLQSAQRRLARGRISR